MVILNSKSDMNWVACSGVPCKLHEPLSVLLAWFRMSCCLYTRKLDIQAHQLQAQKDSRVACAPIRSVSPCEELSGSLGNVLQQPAMFQSQASQEIHPAHHIYFDDWLCGAVLIYICASVLTVSRQCQLHHSSDPSLSVQAVRSHCCAGISLLFHLSYTGQCVLVLQQHYLASMLLTAGLMTWPLIYICYCFCMMATFCTNMLLICFAACAVLVKAINWAEWYVVLYRVHSCRCCHSL